MSLTGLAIPLALLADWLLGEPKKYHPLVGFGAVAQEIERRFNSSAKQPERLRLHGLLGLLLLVLPLPLLLWLIQPTLSTAINLLIDSAILYLCIGGSSLALHARRVDRVLQTKDLNLARESVAMMVSRNTKVLDETGVRRATIESVLENGSDAVVAPLFWFVIAGAPGVIAHRLVNTLDAMWGYRNERYEDFGKAAAKFDDLLNFLPARICALGYLLMGNFQSGWQCWQAQGRLTESPNAGVVMAAGAGALELQLGGAAMYGGNIQERPVLGQGCAPGSQDIERSVSLVWRATLFCALLFIFVMAFL